MVIDWHLGKLGNPLRDSNTGKDRRKFSFILFEQINVKKNSVSSKNVILASFVEMPWYNWGYIAQCYIMLTAKSGSTSHWILGCDWFLPYTGQQRSEDRQESGGAPKVRLEPRPLHSGNTYSIPSNHLLLVSMWRYPVRGKILTSLSHHQWYV